MTACKIVSYPGLDQLLGPKESKGKFVQFRWRGLEYLLFALKSEHRFHNQMLAHFLEDNGVPHQWRDSETLEIGVDDLTVVGGGRFELHSDKGLLVLSDNSTAYGRFDEAGIEAKIQNSGSALRSYTVRVSD